MQNCDEETWNKEYKDIFFGDPDTHIRRIESRARMKPAEKGKQGSLNIKKPDAKTVTDLSQFFGRAGSSGKNDASKQSQQDIAKAKRLTISPGDDGSVSINSEG